MPRKKCKADDTDIDKDGFTFCWSRKCGCKRENCARQESKIPYGQMVFVYDGWTGNDNCSGFVEG